MSNTDAVRENFIAFTEPLEGGIPFLYADIRNLITIAYGNLVDPLPLALELELARSDGAPASVQEITDEWNRVKHDPHAAPRGHLYAKTITKLRLTHEGMGKLALGRFDANEVAFASKLPDWESYPACAMLALHSLAWACGVGGAFKFGYLINALKVRDFLTAAKHIKMNETTPEGLKNHGLVERNARNARLLRNAYRVEAFKLDPSIVEWEAELDTTAIDTSPEEVTAEESAIDDGCTYANKGESDS